jgi:glycosyltransferase involved in cell wall biosynthesis
MPKVSVIMPSYNHEKYVAEAVRSVLCQTFNDLELVIVDDCSSDGTVNEIKKFNDPRIRFFRHENNQGVSVARGKCLEISRGKYIASISSDDVFMPDKLERQVEFLDKDPGIGALFSRAKIIDDDGNDFADKDHFYYSIFKQENRSRHEWLNRFFYKGNCLCAISSLVRKKDIEKIGFYDKRFAQLGDLDLWIRLCMEHDIHILPEELVKFRVRHNEANASGNRPEAQERTRWEYTHILGNYLKIKDPKMLLKIFPEAVQYRDKYGAIDAALIPFIVASIAERSGSPIHHAFALNALYDMMGNEKLARILREKYDFTYIDLIKMTGGTK